MTTINDIPICILKKILCNVSTTTQIHFSMTCKKYYDKLYPSRIAIGTLVNDIFAIKSNRIGRLVLNEYSVGKNKRSYCYICWKINDELFECNVCSLDCCVDCINSHTNFSNIVCKKCDICNNCSRKINTPIADICDCCGHAICGECYNNITFKCCRKSVLCNKCSALCNCCTICKKPRCYKCAPSYGYICVNH